MPKSLWLQVRSQKTGIKPCYVDARSGWRPSTIPALTGSPPMPKTIGIVRWSPSSPATTERSPPTRRQHRDMPLHEVGSQCRAIDHIDKRAPIDTRWRCSCPQRNQPRSGPLEECGNQMLQTRQGDRPLMKPMIWFVCCCAWVSAGHTAAPHRQIDELPGLLIVAPAGDCRVA